MAFDKAGYLYVGTRHGRVRIHNVLVTYAYRYNFAKKSWLPFDKGLPGEKKKSVDTPSERTPATAMLNAGADGSIWLSLYGHGMYVRDGERWVPKGLNGEKITFVEPVPERPSEIYVGTADNWIFHSKDGGTHWQRLPLPQELNGTTLPMVYALAADPNRPDLLWIGCKAYGAAVESPFFNPGKNQKAPAGEILWLADKAMYKPLRFKMGVYHCPFRITIDRKSGLYEAGRGIGQRSRTLYQTAGGTACVIKVDGPKKTTAIKGINGLHLNSMFLDGKGTFLAASEAGIFVKPQGVDDYIFRRPAAKLVYTWAIARDYTGGHRYYYGTGHPAWSWPEVRGIYRFDIQPKGHEQPAVSQPSRPIVGNTGIWTIQTFQKSPDLVYAGSQDRGFLVSRDGGKTFVERNEGLGERNVRCILAEADGTLRFVGTRTSDGNYLQGNLWGPMVNEDGGLYRFDSKENCWRSTAITKATFSIAGESDIIVCATSLGLRVSRDGGRTWMVSKNGLPNGLCSDVKCTPGPNPVFYVGVFEHGVFRSRDLGESWENITYNLGNLLVDELLIDPGNPEHILVATLGGSAYSFVDKPSPGSNEEQRNNDVSGGEKQ